MQNDEIVAERKQEAGVAAVPRTQMLDLYAEADGTSWRLHSGIISQHFHI